MNKKTQQPGEDALRQLMTNHAQQEGRQLWEAYEAAEKNENVPRMTRELDLVCKEEINAYFARKPDEKHRSKVLGFIYRMAACAVLMVMVSMVAFLSADADSHIHVDRYLQNACSLSELKSRYIIHVRLFPGSENQNVEAISKVMAGLTAKGYRKTQEYTNHSATADRAATGLYSCYENEQGQQIRLDTRMPLSGIVIVYKQEGLYATQVEHLGYTMVLVERANSRQIFWLDDAEGLCYSLSTEGLTESEFWDLVYALAQE